MNDGYLDICSEFGGMIDNGFTGVLSPGWDI